MKYAIDRYSVGTEKEVSAEDFDMQFYIPGRKYRFFCPECGEQVYYRSGGGDYSSHFYHQMKTERTPECDKRVDGRSDLSLSERVGLPVYLTGVSLGYYQINIGFPALGSRLLSLASSANYSVEVSGGNNSRKVNVNSTNFIEDGVTLIPVSFIPPLGRNYSIAVSGEKSIYGFHKKWSDYADGFDYNGAVFTFDDNGGKKIRRGDSISTNTMYYAFVRYSLPDYDEISSKEIGIVSFGNTRFKVIEFKIVVSVTNSTMFSRINEYMHRNFGIWLLEKKPSLVPIWPPVVNRDYMIPIAKKKKVCCVVSSCNSTPDVYEYRDYGTLECDLDTTNNVHILELHVDSSPVILSVDRKYVGREIVFRSQNIENSNYTYDIGLVDSNYDRVEWDSLKKGNTLICSNSKMELYIDNGSHIYQHFSIREKTTDLGTSNKISALYFIVSNNVVKMVSLKESGDEKETISDSIRLQIIQGKNGYLVPVPLWADYVIRRLKKEHNTIIVKEIMSDIVDGRMHSGLLKPLRLLCNKI